MYLFSNLVFHTITKYIEIDFLFVRNRLQNKSLLVAFVSSKYQLVDLLTKPISSSRFASLCLSLKFFDSTGDVKDKATPGTDC